VKLLPSVLVAEENTLVSSDLKTALGGARPTWPVFTVTNGDHALAYLRGMARFAAQLRTPVASLLLMSLTLPGVRPFQILDWIKRQALLRSLVIGLISGLGDIPDFDDESSKHSAHALIQRPVEVGHLISLVSVAEAHWGCEVEGVDLVPRLRLPLRSISLLATEIDVVRPTLLSDLVSLTNSPPPV
jgi:CheY-like chemotaxis protein